ncbi:hypothetical protein EMIT019CA3_40057 [Bacillus pseudomycoides]
MTRCSLPPKKKGFMSVFQFVFNSYLNDLYTLKLGRGKVGETSVQHMSFNYGLVYFIISL